MMQTSKEGSSTNQLGIRKRAGSLLGNQSRHHVNDTVATGNKTNSISSTGEILCRACEQPIKGLIVQALGETWHQEHFLCSECKKPITSNRFNVEQGKPYCEDDYANLFLKKCFGCKAPIRDVVVVALNEAWHRDHFVCIMCGTKLASKGFYEKENNPFCQQCYEEKFCPKCSQCNNPITDIAVMALGKKWHQGCFKCKNCHQPVIDSTFEVVNNQPVCLNCINHNAKL